MSLIKKIQQDIEVIEKNYPHYSLIDSHHDKKGTLVYNAENQHTRTNEKLTIGVDTDGSRKLCKMNESTNKWELVGDLSS